MQEWCSQTVHNSSVRRGAAQAVRSGQRKMTPHASYTGSQSNPPFGAHACIRGRVHLPAKCCTASCSLRSRAADTQYSTLHRPHSQADERIMLSHWRPLNMQCMHATYSAHCLAAAAAPAPAAPRAATAAAATSALAATAAAAAAAAATAATVPAAGGRCRARCRPATCLLRRRGA